MNARDCKTIRDLLPAYGAKTIAAEEGEVVEAHLGSCPDCREELEVILALRASRPEVPPGLEARIQARVREAMAGEGVRAPGKESRHAAGVVSLFRRRRLAPAWVLSAAAVVILALGTGVIWSRSAPDPLQETLVVASQEPLPEAWLWDDGMVAGAPVFDGLSDEELEALLKELEG